MLTITSLSSGFRWIAINTYISHIEMQLFRCKDNNIFEDVTCKYIYFLNIYIYIYIYIYVLLLLLLLLSLLLLLVIFNIIERKEQNTYM